MLSERALGSGAVPGQDMRDEDLGILSMMHGANITQKKDRQTRRPSQSQRKKAGPRECGHHSVFIRFHGFYIISGQSDSDLKHSWMKSFE